jgi:septal ring factor EnvC (AmiA/AmiB activator)
VVQQQYNDAEKQQAVLHASLAQKEGFLAETKEQLASVQAKLEVAKEQIGELKSTNARLRKPITTENG